MMNNLLQYSFVFYVKLCSVIETIIFYVPDSGAQGVDKKKCDNKEP